MNSGPPPPYSATESLTGWHHRDDDKAQQFPIRRKPVAAGRPSTAAGPSLEGQEVGTAYVGRDPVDAEAERLKNIKLGRAPPEPTLRVPEVPWKTSQRPSTSDGRPSYRPYRPEQPPATASAASYRPSVGHLSSSTTASSSASSAQPSALSLVQKAYREARHFAGGLIQHPVESTKHYTILRHSHGVVFYQGSKTFVAISIFADRPLPPDRTIWLQNKGWTGKTGMKTKALFGFHDDWVNVTPTIALRSDQVEEGDERAWQRDIKNFRKRGPSRIRDSHKPRETAVVRIPVEVEDGYWQLVLCEGEKKKVLCRSPVFRVLSMSSDPSSIRGASLSTLPLELGAFLVGQVASLAVETVTDPVTSVVEAYLPWFLSPDLVSMANDLTGAGDMIVEKLGAASVGYEEARREMFAKAGEAEVVLEQGPTAPYPLCFVARAEASAREYAARAGVPTMNLSKLPDTVKHRLHGYYFAWVRGVVEKNDRPTTAAPPVNAMPWHQAVLSALDIGSSQVTGVNMAQAIKRRISVRLIGDVGGPTLSCTRLEVRVMGFIRPDEPGQVAKMERGLQAGDRAAVKAAMIVEASDASVVQQTLDHPAWAPDAPSHERGPKEERQKGLMERTMDGFTGMRLKADNVQWHRLGVRTGTDELRDKTVAVNGFYIVR
ncbi:hypothetical protein VTN02DRAFT_5448 [Thermoascus thermophilus]